MYIDVSVFCFVEADGQLKRLVVFIYCDSKRTVFVAEADAPKTLCVVVLERLGHQRVKTDGTRLRLCCVEYGAVELRHEYIHAVHVVHAAEAVEYSAALPVNETLETCNLRCQLTVITRVFGKRFAAERGIFAAEAALYGRTKRALLEKLVIARSDRDDYACILERHEVLAEHTVEQERALVSARPHLIPVVKIAD